MATFRKGTNLIKEQAERKGGSTRFTPNIYWNDGDIRTLVFLTPADDIPKVRLHQMVRIPDDRFERGFRYESFLCRKDPSMVSESGGECELCDTIGHDAQERFVALAMELEPIKEGKRVAGLSVKYNKVARDNGEEVEYPRWGLVVQGAKNFYSWLAAYDESQQAITDVAFEIHREGDSIGTKYHFFPLMAPLPDMTEVLENVPELEELLAQMGSDEKYEALAEVEPGSQPTFGKGNNRETVSPATANSGGGTDRRALFDQIKEQVTS